MIVVVLLWFLFIF